VDADCKWILAYTVPPANVHDSNEFESFFSEQDEVGYADNTYVGKKLLNHVRRDNYTIFQEKPAISVGQPHKYVKFEAGMRFAALISYISLLNHKF